MRVTELICEKLDNPIIFIVKEQKTMAEFTAKQPLPGLLDWKRAQKKACGGKTADIGITGG